MIQSMQRDLASLNQQIEQLKASIAELKAGQPPAPVAARSTGKNDRSKTCRGQATGAGCAAKSDGGSTSTAATIGRAAAGAPAAARAGQRRADAIELTAAAPACAARADNGRRWRPRRSPADVATLGQRERVKRFRAKWVPVRVKKTRQDKRFFILTKKAARPGRFFVRDDHHPEL